MVEVVVCHKNTAYACTLSGALRAQLKRNGRRRKFLAIPTAEFLLGGERKIAPVSGEDWLSVKPTSSRVKCHGECRIAISMGNAWKLASARLIGRQITMILLIGNSNR